MGLMKLLQALARAGALITCLLLASCSSIRVTADYDPRTSFEGLHSFAWIPIEPELAADANAVDNPLISARVTEAIERTLVANGYEPVSEGGDFRVGFAVSVRRALDVRPGPRYDYDYYGAYCYDIPYGHFGHYGRYGFGGPYGGRGFGARVDVMEYEESTLMIDIFDPETDELIWRGTARSRLSSDQTPERSIADINEAVTKILAQFPPR